MKQFSRHEKWGHFWDSFQQITMKIIVSARLTQDSARTKCYLSAVSSVWSDSWWRSHTQPFQPIRHNMFKCLSKC